MMMMTSPFLCLFIAMLCCSGSTTAAAGSTYTSLPCFLISPQGREQGLSFPGSSTVKAWGGLFGGGKKENAQAPSNTKVSLW